MDLCFKTEPTEQRDWTTSSGDYGFNLNNELDCTDCRSFTECGGLKEQDLAQAADANLQYTYNVYFKTLPQSVYGYYSGRFYAMVECNSGFSFDAAGNDLFARECVYDPDQYSSSWISDDSDQYHECLDLKKTKVQIQFNQTTFIDVDVWPE